MAHWRALRTGEQFARVATVGILTFECWLTEILFYAYWSGGSASAGLAMQEVHA